jgi:transposase InsO family protein
MVRPLRQAPGGFTHLLVLVDKFSKWIEARPIVNVRSEEAVSFFTDIIYRFGIPNTIITDNDTQFTRKKFLNFCDDNHIRVDWSAVAHLKTNGQVERVNGMILQVLKPRIFKRLDKFRARWVAELSSVLWSLCTTPCRATGFTPFFMVHGSKAVLPMDTDYGSPQVRAYTEEGNQVALEDEIDQLDEARDVMLLQSAKYQQALRRYHERNVHPHASSMSGILCSDESKAARAGTSYRHLEKDRSSSTRCSDQGHKRSSTRTGRSSPMHGTSNTCTCFILE